MWLIVGLGNPGAQYEQNRHNIGFMAVDEIVRRHHFSPWKKKFSALISEGILAGEKVLILKPQTFMNRSGGAVQQAAQFYKIPLDKIWVFHDELDLKKGQFRVKKSGGHGGHNGLRDISSQMGADYGRLRMGIDHPGDKNLVSSYVLKDFPKSDEKWINGMVEAVADHAAMLVSGKESQYMNKITLAVQPHLSEKKED